MTFTETIRSHQEATATSDTTMLRLLCEFLDRQHPLATATEMDDELGMFLVERLERMPGDMGPLPLWRAHPLFTDEDRENMCTMLEDELADEDLKDRVHDRLDGMDMPELILYACEYEGLGRVLSLLQTEKVNGDFLRENEDDEGFKELLEYAARMKLINEDQDELTELGIQVMNESGE
jgi:hypothetical protein